MLPDKIGVIIGSLRKESYSRKIALQLMAHAAETIHMEIFGLENLTIYNPDLENHVPEEWKSFRDSVRSCTGILFVTPEYNRSIPGVLKNAIDIGSRPPTDNIWNGKPAAIVSVSPGAMGGFGANHHARQCLVNLNMPTMQQPEMYIGNVTAMFDDKGDLKNESTRLFFHSFIGAFKEWIMKFRVV
jgi:chromate reductase, NAD(P)H dehydrogenase (quinone)